MEKLLQRPATSATEEEDEVELQMLGSSPGESTYVVVPPDGGWGWVVAAASFMANLIVDGIIFSFGVFLSPMADDMGEPPATIAMVGSLLSGFYLMVGPFVSGLANRYGFRAVAVAGSILGCVSFAVSAVMGSVTALCFSYGFLGGVGFGFIYVPAVITVGFYFERWRALATGVAVCGSGLGTFAMPPLVAALIAAYGWRGALLILAGLVLNCAVCGLLYRPLQPVRVGNAAGAADVEGLASSPGQSAANNNITASLSALATSRHSGSSRADKRLSGPPSLGVVGSVTSRTRTVSEGSGVRPRPFSRDDIFYSSSLTKLPQYTSQMSSLSYHMSVTHLPSGQDEREESRPCHRTLASMLDLSLLRSGTFLLLSLSGFITMMGFYVPFMYIKERAVQTGMESTLAVWLVSAIGVANTVGRVCCGLLSSLPQGNSLMVNNVALAVGGLATLLSGVANGTAFLFSYAAVFGLAIAAFASLRSILIVDLLGLDKLTNAFGLLLLFQGVAATIGAPLAGAFMEMTGSYNASFHLSGSLILLSAILCMPLNWVNRWERGRRMQAH